jgi:hypothetical protein
MTSRLCWLGTTEAANVSRPVSVYNLSNSGA